MIEEILVQIAREGFLVGNLFQLGMTGRWRANLNDGENCWAFGEAEGAEAALRAALREASRGPGSKLDSPASPSANGLTLEELGI